MSCMYGLKVFCLVEMFDVLLLIILIASNLGISYEMDLFDDKSCNNLTMLSDASTCNIEALHTNPNTSVLNLDFRKMSVKHRDSRSLSFSDHIVAPEPSISSVEKGKTLFYPFSRKDGDIYSFSEEVQISGYKEYEWDDYSFPDDDQTMIKKAYHQGRRHLNPVSTPTEIYVASTVPVSNYTVKVRYRGKTKQLKIYMDKEVVMTVSLNIKDFINQYPYFGFAVVTENLPQSDVLPSSWELITDNFQKQDKQTRLPPKIIVVLSVLSLVLLVACVAGFHKREAVYNAIVLRALRRFFGTPREFKLRDLQKATNNFDETLKLGQGGSGVVFRGLLHKENIEVAVKKFSSKRRKCKDQFLAELSIINRLRHKHLVQLLGWCYKKGMLLLVYEYMPNGSLNNYLFGGPDKRLSWNERYKILEGVASALQYLHGENRHKVVHQSLKASNIMLDCSLNARLGDFGLSCVLDNEKTFYGVHTGVPSTLCYTAPECIANGKATQDSDIYGFGTVLLAVTSGRRPQTKIAGSGLLLVDWVWSLYREGRILEAVDERLGHSYVVDEAERALLLGLACLHPIAKDRPKSHEVLQIILGHSPIPYIPQVKPVFSGPQLILDKTKH